MAETARPGRNFSTMQLVPAVLLVVVSLAAALGAQPLAPLLSGAAWVVFFLALLWTAVLLWRDRPSQRPRA